MSILDSLKKINEQKKLEEDVKKAKEEKRKNYDAGVTYEKLEQKEYCEIPQGYPAIVRPLTLDLIHASFIALDNGQGRWFIWKTITDENGLRVPDKSHILFRLAKKVLEADWVNKPKDQKQPTEIHFGKECHRRVKINKPKGSTYATGKQFLPETRGVMQVIDRKDPQFHAKTKKPKVLQSKISLYTPPVDDPSKAYTVDYSDKGVPFSVWSDYKELFEKIGNEESAKRDFLFWKQPDSKSIKYKVAHCKNEDAILEFKNIDIANISKYGDLTPEESAIEILDVEKHYAHFSHNWIKKNLIQLFEVTDKELGTNFTKELIDICAKETAKWKAANGIVSNDATSTPELKEQSPLEQKCSHFWKHWDTTPEEDKQEVLKYLVDFDENGEPQWKPFDTLGEDGQLSKWTGGKLVSCSRECETKIKLPSKCYTCTKCGKKL